VDGFVVDGLGTDGLVVAGVDEGEVSVVDRLNVVVGVVTVSELPPVMTEPVIGIGVVISVELELVASRTVVPVLVLDGVDAPLVMANPGLALPESPIKTIM